MFFDYPTALTTRTSGSASEGFRDEDAAVAHVNTRPSRTFSRRMPDIVSARPKIINTTIDQDDWGPMGEIVPRGA